MSSIDAFLDLGVVKPLVGLEYGGEQIVNCMICNKPLFIIMKVGDGPTKIAVGNNQFVDVNTFTFQSNCPYCGQKSWKIKADYKVHVGVIEGETTFVDMLDHEPQDGIMSTDIGIGLCKK